MITGIVRRDNEAVVEVLVRDDVGSIRALEAVIDTGLTGFLALSFAGTTRAALGDGREVSLDVFEAIVSWDGRDRDVIVLAASDVLMGMSMLAGHRLMLDIVDGGVVTISALP